MILLALLLAAAPDLDAEAKKHTDALISQGFNLTHGWALDARGEKTSVKFEFFVPEEEGEHTFSFWAGAPQGEWSYRLQSADGKVLCAWSGRRGDAAVTLATPPGKYAVELDRAPNTGGHAVFGIKGPALHRCEVSTQEHPAVPAKGFHWPYLVYLPKELRGSRMLVAPNSTGFRTDELELLRTAASCEVRRQTALADRLGVPLLVPLFPRPATDDLYLHALTRSSLEAKEERFQRVDLQLIAMIDDARANLKVEPEVLLEGFSASGSFVDRFTMLHPERVRAVAVGSPGGWPIAPLAQLDADELTWPVGISDVAKLTGKPVELGALKKVSWLFFLGAVDMNDAVPFRDSFSAADQALIFRRFGKTPVSRWKQAEQLHKRAGLDAKFKLYPGTGHQVSAEMEKDIAAFLEGAR